MSEFLLPGRITAESEFLGGSGACGPTALAAAIRWAMQQDTPVTASFTPKLAKWGYCDANGVSDTPKLRAAAAKVGLTIENPATNEDKIHFAGRALQAVQGAHLGAVVFEVTNGQVLADYLSGSGEDATNLHGHFVMLCGYNSGGNSPTLGCTVPQGFFAVDGDQNTQNPIVNGVRTHRALNTQLVYYPLALLATAQPYDAFSIIQVNKDALTVANAKLAAISKVLSS